MTEVATDRTATFEGRQVEQGSKVFHAGCLCLMVQDCVAHTVQELCVCGGGCGGVCTRVCEKMDRKGKGFIHRSLQYMSCKEIVLQTHWSDVFVSVLFYIQ